MSRFAYLTTSPSSMPPPGTPRRTASRPMAAIPIAGRGRTANGSPSRRTWHGEFLAGAAPVDDPEQQIEPVVAEHDLVLEDEGRHAENPAVIGCAGLIRQIGACTVFERGGQAVGPCTGPREACLEQFGRRDILLLLPEGIEHRTDEGHAFMLAEQGRQTQRRHRIGPRRFRRREPDIVECREPSYVGDQMGSLGRRQRIDIRRPRLAASLKVEQDIDRDWPPCPHVTMAENRFVAQPMRGEIGVWRPEIEIDVDGGGPCRTPAASDRPPGCTTPSMTIHNNSIY